MKKLLLVLMVVAMASFLFVGCLPGTTTPPPEEPPVEPTVTITVAGEYKDLATGITYVQGCVSKLVTVTFTEPVAEEYVVMMTEPADPDVILDVKAGSDRKIWTTNVNFVADECKEQCITIKVGHPCCPEDADTYWKLVVPDCEIPCASFVLTFKDCALQCPPDDYVPGASMSWTTLCGEVCDEPLTCCGDDCSGVGDWTFTADYDICGSCDVETGKDCAIAGAFECGCLTYNDGLEVPVLTGIHEVLVSIKDNVGNEFTDTWTVTFDTDNVLSVNGLTVSGSTPTYDAVKKEWTVKVDYSCTWTDCATCFPID